MELKCVIYIYYVYTDNRCIGTDITASIGFCVIGISVNIELVHLEWIVEIFVSIGTVL